jgi:hypothetical protein
MAERKRIGRPPGAVKDRAAVDRALDLLASGAVSSPQEAAEHPEIKGRISWRTIHEARAKAQKATPQVLDAVPVRALDVRPVELEPVQVEPLSAERAQRGDLVRRMAADGLLDHEAVGRLAVTFGCSEAEASQALQDADRVAAGKKMPPHLALEASLGVYRRLYKQAADANDWKSAMLIQGAIDKLLGVVPGKGASSGPVPEGYVPAGQVRDLLARLRAVLAPWPEARAALEGMFRKKAAPAAGVTA